MLIDDLSIKDLDYEHKLDAENIWNALGLRLEGSLYKVCINNDSAALKMNMYNIYDKIRTRKSDKSKTVF